EAVIHRPAPPAPASPANGRVQKRPGNLLAAGAVPIAAPHGAYPCRPRPTGPNPDRFLAVAVHNDREWNRFRDALGHPAWTADPRFATHLTRCRNVESLDAAMAAWTSERDGEEMVQRFQAQGIAAAIVA